MQCSFEIKFNHQIIKNAAFVGAKNQQKNPIISLIFLHSYLKWSNQESEETAKPIQVTSNLFPHKKYF